MPIRSEVLKDPKNCYLTFSGQTTLREAFAALVSPRAGGEPWWHLVVRRSDGSWAAQRFDLLFGFAEEDPDRLEWELAELYFLRPPQCATGFGPKILSERDSLCTGGGLRIGW